uniref:hypothetical protein n=2 Tax=Aeromonas TaxID=642 RepID=UPI003D198363
LMMNPVPWLQMTNMISYQGLVRTFLRCQRSPIPVGLLITAPELGPQQIKEKEHLLNPDYLETGKQFFVGWGTLMLINAVLAQGKNRSGLAWFFISLLLGPVATLILALVPKRTESQ